MKRSSSERIEVDVDVDAAAGTPRAVRRVVAEHFASHPRLDDLLLCVSEVVTNAVLHGRAPIRLSAAALSPDRVRVEVSDASTVTPIRSAGGQLSPTGRGLHLLDAITTRWDVEVGKTGKTVWFEISGAAGR